MEKICARCQNSLDTSLFYKHKYSKDGLGSWCKVCLKNKSTESRRKAGILPRQKGQNLIRAKETSSAYRNRRKESFIYSITEKICRSCDLLKPASDFKKSIIHKDGYRNHCKRCEYNTDFKSRKAYELKKWAKKLFQHAKKHAKSPVEIDEAFIEELYVKQNGKCFWFNVDLKPSNIAKYPFQPSLDRLDREKGYTRDNVVLACYTANIGRNTSTVEIFQEFIKELKKSLNDKSE